MTSLHQCRFMVQNNRRCPFLTRKATQFPGPRSCNLTLKLHLASDWCECVTWPLQLIQDAATWPDFNKFSHTTPPLHTLHWLDWIRFKALVLADSATNGSDLSYNPEHGQTSGARRTRGCCCCRRYRLAWGQLGSMLTSREISLTWYKDVFDIMSKLLVLHILLIVLVINSYTWDL